MGSEAATGDEHIGGIDLAALGVDPVGLRTLTQHSPDVIMILDLDCAIQFINWTAPGLDVEQVIGTTVYDHVPRTQHEEMQSCFAEVRRTKQPGTYRNVYELPDGSGMQWESRVAPVDRRGRVVGFTVFARDVTERNLRAIELSRFFDLSLDFLCIANLEGYFTRVNGTFSRVLGYSEKELLSRPAIELVHPEDTKSTMAAAASVAEGHAVVGFENRYRTRDGKYRRLSWQASLDPGGQRVLCVARDVTEQRELELQLRHAQKMDAVGQLAGGIAHDFNNLLLAVLVNAEFAAKALSPDQKEVQGRLQEVEKAGRRAAALTGRLLAFSRPAPIDARPVDVNVVARELIVMLRRLIPENIALQFHPAEALPRVAADAGQLEQVLMNLCVNARDAMPNGGQLVIETSPVEVDECLQESYPWVAPGPHVMLSVRDTGHGMGEGVRERLFEPFFTTKNPGRGTGLGLATAYAITKQHGGVILVRSEPGKGALFRVYLPVTANVASATPAPFPQPLPNGRGTILVAEDEDLVRNIVVQVLEKAGYSVRAVKDGKQAVDAVLQHPGEIDLALLDVVMPELSGPEAYGRLVELEPALPVLFTSGYSDGTSQASRVPDGCRLLSKPYRTDDLLRAIREVLEGS